MRDRCLQARIQKLGTGRKDNMSSVIDSFLDRGLSQFPVFNKITAARDHLPEGLLDVRFPEFMAVYPAGLIGVPYMHKSDLKCFRSGLFVDIISSNQFMIS